MARVYICDKCVPLTSIEGPVFTLGFGERDLEYIPREGETGEDNIGSMTPFQDLCLKHANEIRTLLGLRPFTQEGITEEDEESNILLKVSKGKKGKEETSVEEVEKKGKTDE